MKYYTVKNNINKSKLNAWDQEQITYGEFLLHSVFLLAI